MPGHDRFVPDPEPPADEEPAEERWFLFRGAELLVWRDEVHDTLPHGPEELGLGTLDNPNGLPYANDALVVTVLENLTSNALDATMYTSNPFSRFRTEINANRPLISFIPGHSRTVAGYTDTSWIFGTGFQGLLVYDPWPPNAGVITKWENFNASTYRRTFTARVTLV